MDLVLWRHAQAEDASIGMRDHARCLTRRGEKQAARIGAWLARELPHDARILASPARRTEQTVMALGRAYELCPRLAPGASVDDLLELAGWPDAHSTVLVVGHQPTLGQAISRLLGWNDGGCAVRKACVWWLRSAPGGAQGRATIVAVQPVDMVQHDETP